MISQRIVISGMVSSDTHMSVGSLFNIYKIEDEIVWCYPHFEIFGDHQGCVQLLSTKHIRIRLSGIGVNGELGDGTIHELKCNPKFTNSGYYCFSFLSKASEFYSAEEARRQFLVELGIKADQHRVINMAFSLRTAIEENANLIGILQYKNSKCPQCDGKLYKVYRDSDSYLNQEQFDAVKAGDYYCDKCPPNGRGKDDLCYWWNKELDRGPFVECFKN